MPARSLSREKMTVLVGLFVLSLLTANASQLDGEMLPFAGLMAYYLRHRLFRKLVL